MVHFTRACKTLLSENNKTRLTFEKQQEKNKNIICRPWSVRIEKNCALGLERGPRPAACGLRPRAVLKTSGTVFLNTDLPAGK